MGDHSTLGRVWSEGRASGCYGWSWASPELRGQACYNLMPMATGRNLLFRQNVQITFPFCFHLMLSACPDSLFGLTELSTTGKELGGQGGSQASDHSPQPLSMLLPQTCQAWRHLSRCKWAAQSSHYRRHTPPPAFQTPHKRRLSFLWQRAINSERVCLCGRCHLPA